MLRATEQLTWSAVLDRFKRGYEVTSSNAATGKNQNDVDWQFFSGKHLRCKVTFTKPIDTAWPMQQLPSQKSRLLSNNEDSLDRQLRIIVECGPIEADDEQKRVDAATKLKGIVARSRSSSQTIAPLVLVRSDQGGKSRRDTSRKKDADAQKLFRSCLDWGFAALNRGS